MKLYNMFNTQNSENQILLSGTYFRPNKGMPSPPLSGVSMKESRPIRDKPVGYLQACMAKAVSACHKKQAQLEEQGTSGFISSCLIK